MADDKKKTATPEERAQQAADEVEEKGYIGTVTDPTPNERYALTSDDWRTPETDPDAARAAGSTKFQGVNEEAT